MENSIDSSLPANLSQGISLCENKNGETEEEEETRDEQALREKADDLESPLQEAYELQRRKKRDLRREERRLIRLQEELDETLRTIRDDRQRIMALHNEQSHIANQINDALSVDFAVQNRRHGQRRQPRWLSAVEFYGALIWLALAVSSLAFRKKDLTTFADLSYVWSTVGLIVTVIYSIERASRILSARRYYNNQCDVVIFMTAISAAIAPTAFWLFLSAAARQEMSVSSVGIGLFWNWLVYFIICVYNEPVLDAFKQSLLISGWFSIADLATALYYDGIMLASGLYALVALLWIYNFLLEVFI